ncbi:MAG: glycogen synthase GlgA [Mobilitalea sp.]
MKVLFAAAESAPFFKTGGLGDVVGALPKALVRKGYDVRVILPCYGTMPEKYKDMLQEVVHFNLEMGWKSSYCGIKRLILEGVTYYFIDNHSYYNREQCYGYWDDGERFAFFSMAVCEAMEKIDFIPDIVHAHDWHVAMIPVLLVHKYHWVQAYRHIRKIFTIHNLQFQGVYDPILLESLFGIGYDVYREDGVKYYDRMNFLKGGINYSDRVTTVSPSYAHEIQTPEFGEGLDEVLRYNQWKIRGIINGIDTELNNPKKDPLIACTYDARSLRSKRKNKTALQERLGLTVDEDVALIGMVTRLTDQKGIPLVLEALPKLIAKKVQLVILGTGDPGHEHALQEFAHNNPKKVSVIVNFDLALAQNIYAGGDIFLMPSAFEPCGLSQMIAFRYGCVPLVHETGGLRDTVIPYNLYTGEGTGFSFYDFTGEALLQVLDAALQVYYDNPEQWKALFRKGMKQDFSWNASVHLYEDLYQELLTEK